MTEVILTNENFEKEVLKSDKTVLVDFYAEWCGPCKMMSPVVEEIAAEGNIKVGKVNVDDETNLSMKYNIDAVPCFIVFKNGSPVNRKLGYCSKADLLEICK